MSLSPSQEKALETILNGETIFLTGSPGTGKSYILQTVIEKLINKNIGITATTGCAAVNIGGTTLHSFFNIKPDTDITKHTLKSIQKKDELYHKLNTLDLLIIDEVSMLDSVLCNNISYILKKCNHNEIPFGGIQILFVGDFFQLPPVTNSFCFLSESWIKLNPKVIELTESIRQSDDKLFQLILSKLRFGKLTKQIYDILEKNKELVFTDITPTKLYPNNVDVNRINLKEMEKLLDDNKSMTFNSFFNKSVNATLKSKLIDYNVILCVGVQVMITRNISIVDELVNGSRGVIVDIDKNHCFVKTVKGVVHKIGYTNQEYKNNFVKNLNILFMPIKLAYAITIHKSQGATIDYLEIDLGSKIFEYGQGYTALSRGKKLENIKIIDLSANSFKVHPSVLKWFNTATAPCD
jgi:ATP-dependent exoDNAse (exonuclease V) alpha subunit